MFIDLEGKTTGFKYAPSGQLGSIPHVEREIQICKLYSVGRGGISLTTVRTPAPTESASLRRMVFSVGVHCKNWQINGGGTSRCIWTGLQNNLDFSPSI